MTPSLADRIPLWIDLRGVPVNKRLPYWKAVRGVCAEQVLLGRDDPHLDRAESDPITLVDGRNTLKQEGKPVGRYVIMRSVRDQDRAKDVDGIVVVESDKWSIIPLENLIAARRDRPGTLFAIAKDPEEALRFRDTLEVGVHGIVLQPTSPKAIDETHAALAQRGPRIDDRPAETPATSPDAQAGTVGADTPRPPQDETDQEHTPGADPGNDSSHDADVDAPAPTGIDMVGASPHGRDATGPDDTSSDSSDSVSDDGVWDVPDVDEEGLEEALDVGDAPIDPDFLEVATITEIRDAGPGDRVCIDTTSIFRPGEGLLIGSTARSFALVHAETIETQYVRARPFRVNAGAIHSYIYAPDGKTHYLSELRSGSKVLAVHPDGIHRIVTVGRAKIERRPHSLVKWRTQDGFAGSAILQTAETIRLVRADKKRAGQVVAVTDLKKKDQILVHREQDARHFGMPVKAFLKEQ